MKLQKYIVRRVAPVAIVVIILLSFFHVYGCMFIIILLRAHTFMLFITVYVQVLHIVVFISVFVFL